MDSIIYSKVFWGVVVLLIGISIIAQAVFKINISVFKIVLGLFLLYMGFKVLVGAFGINVSSESSSSVFSSQSNSVDFLVDGSEYSTVFGSQVVDLTMVSRSPGTYRMECNAVFGSCKVFIPNDIEVNVQKNAVFGSVRDNSGQDFNSTADGLSAASVKLEIEANAVFGSVEIYRR